MAPVIRWTRPLAPAGIVALTLLATACQSFEPAAPEIAPPAPAPRPSLTIEPSECTTRWIQPVSGDWISASNWSGGSIPGPFDIACIDEPGSYTVTLISYTVGSAHAVAGLLIGDGASDIVLEFDDHFTSIDTLSTPRLTVTEGASLLLGQCKMLRATGETVIDGTLALTDCGGYLTTTHEIAGPLTNRGSLYLGGFGDSIVVRLGDPYTPLSQFTNSGRIEVRGATEVRLAGQTSASVAFEQGTVVDINIGSLIFTNPDLLTASLRWAAGEIDTWAGTGRDLRLEGVELELAGPDLAGSLEVVSSYAKGAPWVVRGDVPAGVDLLLRTHAGKFQLEPLASAPAGTAVVNEGTLIFKSATTYFPLVANLFDNRGKFTAQGGRAQLEITDFRNDDVFLALDSVRFVGGVLRQRDSIRALQRLVIDNAEVIAGSGSAMVGTLSLTATGRLSGSGTFDRVVVTGGRVSPGNGSRIGSLTVGTLTLDAASRVIMDVAGTQAGLFDLIRATDRLTLGGTLEIQTDGGYLGGRCGDGARFLTQTKTAVRTGTFASYQGLALGANRAWRVGSNATSLELLGYSPATRMSYSPTAVAVTEGGPSQAGSLCLGPTTPTASVIVEPTSFLGQSSATPNPITFTTSNWMFPKPLSIVAIDDLIAEAPASDRIRFRVTSSDAGYNAIAVANLPVTVTDNDPGVDLVMTMVSGLSVITAGQRIEPTFRVTNNGPGASSGSTMTFAPIAGLALVRTVGITCTATVGLLTCPVGPIPAGSSVDFQLVFDGGAAGGYSNTLTVVGLEYDPVASNNSWVWSLTVN